jgi:hypothetical protein
VTILSGTFLLHKTKDMGNRPAEISDPSSPQLQLTNITKSPDRSEI